MAVRRSGAAPLIAILVVSAAFLALVFVKSWSPQLGLDLQGGASVVLRAVPAAGGAPVSPEQRDTALEIIRSRVDALGVAEPEIVPQGGDLIVVDLPGITDACEALKVIRSTAELRFRPVLKRGTIFDPNAPTSAPPPTEAPPTTAAGETTTTAPGATTQPTTAVDEGTTTTSAAPPAGRPATHAGPTTSTTTGGDPTTSTAPPTTDATSGASTTTTTAPTTSTTLADPCEETPVTSSTTTPTTVGEATTTSLAPTTTTAAPATTEADPGSPAIGGVVLRHGPTTTTTVDPGAPTTTADPPATTIDPLAPTTTLDPSATTAPAPTGDLGKFCVFDPNTFDVAPLSGREEDLSEATVVLPDKDGFGCYQLGPVPTDGTRSLVGSIVENPEVSIDAGQWRVNLGIKGDSLALFNQTASECFNQFGNCPNGALAIVLDGAVQSAPSINEPAFDEGTLQISGAFTEEEARGLALVLRFGALPIELEAQTVRTVSPSLGRESLDAGLAAGFVGIALVAVYMLLYYRALGVVVLLGLSVWSALNFSIISWLGETQGLALSLSGVTGIIVSVGVTVDSYIVYFERLKDEIRSGKTIRSSVDRGFQRAFRTILTADIASFIGAALLYTLTVGAVRGFAFFLGLSTLLDVVVAYFFTRPLVGRLGRSGFFTRSRLFGVARGLGVRDTGSVA